MRWRLRADDLLDREDPRDAGADEDREHDREAGVPLGPRGAQEECGSERNRSQGVAEVVDQVGEKGNASGRDVDDHLGRGGRSKHPEREAHGAQAGPGALDAWVDQAVRVAMPGCIVRMWPAVRVCVDGSVAVAVTFTAQLEVARR